MAAQNTKQEIVSAFVDMARKSSLRKVRIAVLIDEVGVNRNTFYYHFANKDEVALYKFRVDLARELSRRFDEGELLYAPVAHDSSAERLPFYVHVEIGAHTLDFSGFYRALVTCVRGDEAFYRKVFTVSEPEFNTLFVELYGPAVKADMRFILGGRYLPDATFDFISMLLTEHLANILQYALSHPTEIDDLLDDKINPFWNLPYEALTYGLQTHPVNRLRRR